MKFVLHLLISGFSVFIASYILSGIKVNGFLTAVIVAVVLGIVNAFIKPILILLTLPINLITLGLFTLIINGVLVLLVSAVVKGFYVQNILWAILFSLVVAIISSFLNKLAN